MSNKILNLDLAKDNTFPAIIYGRIGDDRLQTVTVNITRRSEPVDLTGYTITFEGVTHGGQTKVFDSDNVGATSAELKKGTFDYTFPSAAFAVAGKYEQAYFSIVKDGKRDTTGDFEILVLSNADINAAEAETVITEYNKLVAELQEIQKSNIADLQKEQDTYIQSTDKTFAAIQGRITNLQNAIKGFETSVNDTAADVLSTVNQALEELKAGDFYTQLEADDRFAKSEDMSAHTANVGNPHKVNKKQIGLGNVDNYSTATQAEAEAGESNSVFMTPKAVFQAIAKWVQGKFVSATGNETILGTKNFQDGLQLGGKSVLTQDGIKYQTHNSTTDSSIQSGTVYFERYGDWINCFVNIQVRSSADLVRDNNILGVVNDEFLPRRTEVFFLVATESHQATVKITGSSLKAHSTLVKNGWFIGTVTYLAKNKL